MRPAAALLPLFLLLCAPAHSQITVTSGPPPGLPPAVIEPPSSSLASALAAARPPSSGLVLTVGADGVPLTDGASLPGPRTDIRTIAAAFGRATHRFGSIVAVAPPLMSVFNASPADPDPFANLRPADALKRLAASLSDSQWRALVGPSGLGVADLTSPVQRALFDALFPGDLTVSRAPLTSPQIGDRIDPNDSKDLSGARGQIKMRLGVRPQFRVAAENRPNTHVNMYTPRDGRAWRYFWPEMEGETGTVYGVKARDDVPNVPKRGQLDWDAAKFGVGIKTAGIETVGQLITRIANATQTEIYADARWEKKQLTILGTATTARASDWLRALAFCLTGTYRKVGPAFVLTDDLLGRATLRQIWSDWSKKVEAARQEPMRDAESKLAARHASRDLTALPGGVALTDEQKKRAMAGYGPDMDGVPLDKLPPEQQQIVRRLAREFIPDPETPDGLALDGKIGVSASVVMEFTAPGLDGPVEVQGFGLPLGQFSQEPMEPTPEETATAQAQTDAAIVKPTPIPKLIDVLQSVPKRAVLAAPRTVEDVNALLASMKSLGFNQLWLDVFSDGVARLPGVPLSDAPLVSNAGPNVLDAAIATGRKTGIQVFASFDLLRWGKDAPASVADLSVLGEPSPMADARARDLILAEGGPNTPPEYVPPPADPRRMVSPFSPGVRESLTDLVRAVAVRPGLAGLVWRDTAATGYVPGINVSRPTLAVLGFTEAARWIGLRHLHADPIDIVPPGTESIDDALGGLGRTNETPNDDLQTRWDKLRADADLSLLRALWNAVPAATPNRPRLSVIVRQRHPPEDTFSSGESDWFASWDNPKLPPPAFRSPMDNIGMTETPPAFQDAATQARRSRVSFFVVPPSASAVNAAQLAESLSWRLANEKWRGLVLDMTGRKTDAGNPLAALAESVKRQTGGLTNGQKAGANAGK